MTWVFALRGYAARLREFQGGIPGWSGHSLRFALIDLSRLFHAPSRPEPPSIVAARSKMAMRLSWMTAVLGLGLFVVDRLTGVPTTADSMMTLVLAVMGALSWVLLKFRHYNSVAWLLVVFLFGMAAASTWFFGSVRTVNIVLILIGQVASGIYLSRRDLVWTTVAAISLLGVLTWADAAGMLAGQPRFVVGWRTWMTQGASLLGVAAMMYLNRTQMHMAQALHLREAMQRLKTQLDRDIGQDRFARLFQSSPTPIFVQSARTGVILDVNRSFERTLGYARKDVLNRREGFLWLQDEDHQRFVRDRRATRRTGWHPITALSRDGRPLALQISCERDDDLDDGMVITAMRMPGSMASALPTVHAPLEGRPDA
jgi:PAS domain S-box-containing protein